LQLVNLLKKSPNPDYELLFGVGVDPATPAELNSAIAHIQWPRVDKVWEYRQQVYEIVVEIIKNVPLNLPIHPQHSLWSLMMGIEHQRIHFETSSMLLRQLPLDCLQRPPGWHYAPAFGQA
jgi:dTDP-4-amino-4,6-dideoxygalactose transaminase